MDNAKILIRIFHKDLELPYVGVDVSEDGSGYVRVLAQHVQSAPINIEEFDIKYDIPNNIRFTLKPVRVDEPDLHDVITFHVALDKYQRDAIHKYMKYKLEP